MTDTPKQILTREYEDQQYLYYDLHNSKKVRENALRRMRVIERQLGWAWTPGPNEGGLKPGQIVYYDEASNIPEHVWRMASPNLRRQGYADRLMIIGWMVAITGLMLLAAPVATKIAIGVTFGGFVVALAGAMVRP